MIHTLPGRATPNAEVAVSAQVGESRGGGNISARMIPLGGQWIQAGVGITILLSGIVPGSSQCVIALMRSRPPCEYQALQSKM